MTNNIRRPLFDGVREIHAIWFDLPLIGEQEARRRILAHWQIGASVHHAGGGYLLTLAGARFADCATLDGLALCRVDQVLSSAPLEADEKHAVAPAGCCLVRGAHALVCRLGDAERIDPAGWIDTSAIVIRQPLAIPVSKVNVSIEAPEEAKSLREILDDVIPPPSEKRAKFLREHAAGSTKQERGTAAKAGLAVAAGAGLAAAAGAGLLAMLLRRVLGGTGAGNASSSGAGGGSAAGTGTSGAAQEGGGKVAPDPKWKQMLFAAASRLADMTKLSKALGWRQAAYLRDMVDMFERGDIEEALRHAIPVDGKSESTRQALGAPTRRSSLDISAPGGTTPSIHLDTQMNDYLRQSYRKMFARLEREGRIDEATFVLAELLQSPVEAVDFLERNKRFKQAAQLADKLQLAPEVALRLWFLAGDSARAVRIARLTGSFADAVRKLELMQHELAAPLRMEWASWLAARGDFAEAADAIWPLTGQRDQALAWLIEAQRNGGDPGARALVRKLALMPEALADSAAQIAAVLDAPDADGVRVRMTLCRELTALSSQSAATRRLAGELLRHVIAERSAGSNQVDRNEVNRLMRIADSGVLESDLPPIAYAAPPAAQTLSSLGSPLQVQGGEHALMQIHDARRLPCGHYLLALGESGVLRITAQGRHVVHFPLPAHHLVLSHNGERALALARRGDVVRISRIDVAANKVTDWISHPFDTWAGQYDGVTWNAVIDNRIVAIDTTQERLAVVWQVADLNGKIVDFHDDGTSQTILIGTRDDIEQWRYTLPERRLSQRDSYPLPREDVPRLLAHPASQAPLQVRIMHGASGSELCLTRPTGTELQLQLGQLDASPLVEVMDGWLFVQMQSANGDFRCLVADRRVHTVIAELRLEQAAHPRMAAHGNHLLLFDRAGRLLDIDTTTCAVHSMTLS